MANEIKGLVDITTGEEVSNADARYATTSSVDQTLAGVKTFNDPIKLNTSPTVGDQSVGKMYWDNTNKTLAIDLSAGGGVNDVTLQVGQEDFVYIFNNSGVNILNGQPVYLTGESNGIPTIALGRANSEATSKIIGLATQNIDNGTFGYITKRGILHDVDTLGLTTGSISSFADAGDGKVRATCPAHHKFTTGNSVVITETTNYNATYVVTVISEHIFEFTATFNGTETGTFTSNAWTVKDALWLSYGNAGHITNIKPIYNDSYAVQVGSVLIKNETTGSIIVDLQPFTKLTDLGDVSSVNATANQLLVHNGYRWVNGVPTSLALTGNLSSDAKLTFDEADWSGGNVIYVPIDGDINTYIGNATAGDTLILASGTYTITDSININKAVRIVGQDDGTVISSTQAGIKLFNISSSNSSISKLKMRHTGTGTVYGIYIYENLTGIVLKDLTVTLAGSDTKYGIGITSSSAILMTIVIFVSSSDVSRGIQIENNSSTTDDTIVTMQSVMSSVIGSDSSAAYYILDYNSAKTNAVNLIYSAGMSDVTNPAYESDGMEVESIPPTGTKCLVNAYYCTFKGNGLNSYDVEHVGNNTINFNLCELYYGKTLGNINCVGTLVTSKIYATDKIGIGTITPTSSLEVVEPTAGIGTVSNSASGTTITGTNTEFKDTFKIGDIITVNGENITIVDIVSDTELTTTTITNANTNASYTLTGGLRFAMKANGHFGVGLLNPKDKIHVYGTDNSVSDDPLAYQRNSIIVDGVADGDKQYILADDGVYKWAWQNYRDESSKYLYLYSYEAKKEPMVISSGGRIGFNQPSNIMNYHSFYTGTGLNDVDIGGMFDKNYDLEYQVAINGTGTPNTFHFRTSLDAGLTWSNWYNTTNCSETPIDIMHGVTIVFGNTTGHNTDDTWEFTAFAQLPQSTFSVNPSMFVEANTTIDYTNASQDYEDVTYNIANSIIDVATAFIPIGIDTSNKGAIYLGMNHQFNSMYINIVQPAVNCTLVLEYWNGSAWTTIDGGRGLVEETNNLVNTGLITWFTNMLTGWVKRFPEYNPDETGYELYWIRLRSSTIMTTAPTVRTVVAQGSMRFAVYGGHMDSRPSLYVDTLGGVHIQKNSGFGASLEVLNFDDYNNRIRFNTETNNPHMDIYTTAFDDNHKTVYKYGGIDFDTTGVDAVFSHKYNRSFKFYKDVSGDNDLVLSLENDGTLSVGTTGYESLVINDNDIPNKKYVDSLLGGMILQGNWNADTNTPDITGTTSVGFAWIVAVHGHTDLGGITEWAVGDMAVKTSGGWTKINPIPAIWGAIGGTLADQSDLQGVLDDKLDTSALSTWTGTSYIATVGTITVGTWHGDRIGTTYLDTSVTAQGNTFNGANQLVKMTADTKLPILDGSNLTGLVWSGIDKTVSSIADLTTRSATDLTSGNLNIARLPVSGTWNLTAPLVFNNTIELNQPTIGIGTVSNLAGSTTVTGVGTQFTHTFKVGDTITIPATTGQTVTIAVITSDTSMTTATITNENTGVAYSLVGGTKFIAKGNGMVNLGLGANVNEFSIDGTMDGNSDNAVPTEKAVKTYADTKVNLVQTTPQTIGATGNRLAKLWTTDLTVTNEIAGTISKAVNMTGGNNTTLLGSIGYQSATDTTTLLSPNTTTTKKYLSMTGDGTNGGVPAWDDPNWVVVTKTGNYNLATTDTVCLVDTTSTAISILLPTAVGVSGKRYVIKRISAGTNRLTVTTTSSQTIDGLTTAIIDEQYSSISVVSDGANWYLI